MATRCRVLVDLAPMGASTPTIQYRTMSDLLRDFRHYLEREAGEPIQQIEAPAALILNDLCTFLMLSDSLKRKVLGTSALAWVNSQLGDQPNKLPVIH